MYASRDVIELNKYSLRVSRVRGRGVLSKVSQLPTYIAEVGERPLDIVGENHAHILETRLA